MDNLTNSEGTDSILPDKRRSVVMQGDRQKKKPRVNYSGKESTAVVNPSSMMNKRVQVPGFLTKTFDIFSNKEFSELCGWSSDGKRIVIKKPAEFSARVLPKYFKHSNFQSFVRQLNMYEFRKTVQDPNNGEFKHPNFQRGRYDLLPLIKRKATTTVQKDAASEKGNSDKSGKGKIPSNGERTPSVDHSSCPSETALNDPATLKKESEALLDEMNQLRRWRFEMEDRMSELEYQNSRISHENDVLWQALRKHTNQQQMMQSKLQKLLFLIYDVYVSGDSKSPLLNPARLQDSWRLIASLRDSTDTDPSVSFRDIVRGAVDDTRNTLMISDGRQPERITQLEESDQSKMMKDDNVEGSLASPPHEISTTSVPLAHASSQKEGASIIREDSDGSQSNTDVLLKLPSFPPMIEGPEETSKKTDIDNKHEVLSNDGSLQRLNSLRLELADMEDAEQSAFGRIDSVEATLSQMLDSEDLAGILETQESFKT